MCGVAGQVSLVPGVTIDLATVRTMTGVLRHRGPDGEGMYVDPGGRAALGHRRLAVIDLTTGAQPIFNEDRSIAIVFNGEIYNFKSLRRDLEIQGHRFTSDSDTEVIVHLYEEHGVECVRKLRGMFAFLLWDERRGRLLAARDKVGKKPVYFVEGNGRLSLASEIAALYAIPDLDWTLDATAIDFYLTHSYIPSPYSVLRSVRKLPAGHRLVAERGKVHLERYWDPPHRTIEMSVGEAEEQLVTTLTEAVKLRLIADVPLGALLSGGTDSSIVVALMAHLAGGRVRTFSVGFEHEAYSELRYARTVAQVLGTEHAELIVKADAVAILPALVEHFGEPFGDSSAVAVWCIAELARQHVTVALTGDGGDELFGGYDWYGTASTVSRATRLVPPGLRRLARGINGRYTRNLPRQLAKALDLLCRDSAAQYGSLRRTLEDQIRDGLYVTEFADRLDGASLQYLDEVYRSSGSKGLPAMILTDLQSYLPEDVLTKVDRASMAWGLETRSPLLDAELVSLALTLPPEMKRRHGRGKQILRKAFAHFFPPAFLDRPKKGFSLPIDEWLRGDLRECRESLLAGPLAAARIVEPAALRRLLNEHDAGRAHGATIWNLLFLAEWLKRFGGRARWA